MRDPGEVLHAPSAPRALGAQACLARLVQQMRHMLHRRQVCHALQPPQVRQQYAEHTRGNSLLLNDGSGRFPNGSDRARVGPVRAPIGPVEAIADEMEAANAV